MIISILCVLGIVACVYLLSKICDQYFVSSLDVIAKRMHLSEDVAGATLMAIGSSSPEFFTSLIALIHGSNDVGPGTIVGSAIFNILVIVGCSSIVATAYLNWKPVARDMGFYIIAIIILILTFRDGKITMPETLVYLVAYAAYIALLSQWSRWFPDSKTEEELGKICNEFSQQEEEESKATGLFAKPIQLIDRGLALLYPSKEKEQTRIAQTFFVSLALIIGITWILVDLALGLAHAIGAPEVVIALTVLAAGNSFPDLLSSIIVARQGRGDMAVSNAVGSNSFDILIGLGLPWLIFTFLHHEPVTVHTENLSSSVILLGATVVAMFFVLAVQRFKINRYSGIVLLLLYATYLAYAIYTAFHPGELQLHLGI